MSRLFRLTLPLVLCLATCAQHALAAPSAGALDVAAVWQLSDNASRAFDTDEEETAERFRLEFLGHRDLREVDGRGLDLQGHLALEAVPDFDDLDRSEVGLRARWTFVAGSGYGLPFLSLEAGATGLRHRDSPIRDGVVFDAGLVTGARSTDLLQWEGGYLFELRRARRASVWNTINHRLFVRAERRTSRTLALWARAAVSTGDVVATGSPSLELLARAAARADDDAFDEGRIAYRLTGEEAMLAVGAAWQPAQALGVELALAHRWIDAEGGVDYAVAEATASAVWRLR